jgi:hypothetical protein
VNFQLILFRLFRAALSPNFFPLYKDKDAVMPVPELLEDMGLSEREKNAMMDLIIEASGKYFVIMVEI